jgi:predicted secreted hydrolase
MKVVVRIFTVILILAGIGWLAWPRPQPAAQAEISGLQVTPGTGFKRATGPMPLTFPKDFGAHPDYQTEWWYYTGNLQAASGEQFGFELTFFRRALVAPDQQQARASDWAASQVYMAHLALTSARDNQFHYFERFSRGAAGLAGAVGLPFFSVWLQDWQVQQVDAHKFILKAVEGNITLDLILTDVKGPILQGDLGYSQKGPEPGDASYYVSQTRLQTTGAIQIGSASYAVTGLSWMDHEFSTGALSQGQVGWDWFALQLDDGSELIVYTLRRSDGTIDPYSRGTLIHPDGSVRTLKRDEFSISSDQTWKSPGSGAVYPSHWSINVPSEDLTVSVSPVIPDQELRLSFTYWEGAVRVDGKKGGQTVTGSGYVELTGYAQSMAGQF